VKSVSVLLYSLFFVALSGSIIRAQRKEPEKTEVHGHTMYTLLNPGEIPAIFEPEFIPVNKADRYFYPDEPLLVVNYGGTVKAYSTWQLDRHEVVNDYIDSKAITITW
jgi:hypothetical protein